MTKKGAELTTFWQEKKGADLTKKGADLTIWDIWGQNKALKFYIDFGDLLYRVFKNEGHTENGHKTPKIWVLDHLFGISVFHTSERFVRNTNLSSKYQ